MMNGMTAVHALSDTEHMTDMPQVTIRELSRNTAEVVERVAAGEEIEVTRNGQPVAVMHAPDPVDMKMRELVKAGVIPPDILQRQAEFLRRMELNPPPPADPGMEPASETLIKMRREEKF
jgi:antitoxin (DNA-binding transcriptional repressor) of toxin-antitoxin stability system